MDASGRLAQRAVDLLDTGSVEAAANHLGVSSRHLRRVLRSELGVAPMDLVQSRRVALARRLLRDTGVPVTQVALASGFSSVRRFNAAFLERAGRPPSAFRKHAAASDGSAVVLHLDYRPPLDFAGMLAFLAPRATPGFEAVDGDSYARTLRVGKRAGWVRVEEGAKPGRLKAEVTPSLLRALPTVVQCIRRMFDLDARPDVIRAALSASARLRPLVKARPGLRVPGAMDPFELAVRAILGQQVSVAAATTLAGRVAEKFGASIATPDPRLTRVATSSAALASANPSALARLGVLPARARTLVALARAVEQGDIKLDGTTDAEATIARLCEILGICDWTAQYIAMRALGWPDAFPAGDLVLRRELGAKPGEAAEQWRPWRAYAAIHIWAGQAKKG
jgi:AraC family transcriptional regulator of adaptative response / DNA-3-methyladenine glycosylase II